MCCAGDGLKKQKIKRCSDKNCRFVDVEADADERMNPSKAVCVYVFTFLRRRQSTAGLDRQKTIMRFAGAGDCLRAVRVSQLSNVRLITNRLQFCCCCVDDNTHPLAEN